MPRYSLVHRSNRSNIYIALKDPLTGEYLPARSSGTSDEQEAHAVAWDWSRNGVPDHGERRPISDVFTVEQLVRTIRSAELTTHDAERILAALEDRELIAGGRIADERPSNEPFGPWLEAFWSPDSDYIREKRATRQSVTDRYIRDMNKWAARYWSPFFADTALGDVTRQRLRDFMVHLDGKGLAAGTIRKVMVAGTTPLRWAAREGLIPSNPADGLRQIHGKSEERGILTPDESRQLFAVTWDDRRAYVGNLVACTCGLRSGEVLALRASDIGDDRLHVRHSWNPQDRILKEPKNGESREAPLLPAVRAELLALLAENPYRDQVSDPFVFWNVEPDRPAGPEVMLKGLRAALVSMRLGEGEHAKEERDAAERYWVTERRVSFHSWRHQFATELSAVADLGHLMEATGHKDRAVALAYAAHQSDERWRQVAGAIGQTFGNIVPFAS